MVYCNYTVHGILVARRDNVSETECPRPQRTCIDTRIQDAWRAMPSKNMEHPWRKSSGAQLRYYSNMVKIASHVVAGSEGRGSATPTLGSEL